MMMRVEINLLEQIDDLSFEEALKVENERVLSQLLEENESQEALMLAKHDGEEEAARKKAETERNDSLRPSAPSLPRVPECPVGNLTELRVLKTTISTSKKLWSCQKSLNRNFSVAKLVNRPKVAKEL